MKTASKLISGKMLLIFLAALGTASAARAQGELATGTVSGLANGGSYDYTITLNNISSSVSIGSFWYSWTPTIAPFFYLPSNPTSASAPAGWTAVLALNSIQYSGGPGVFLAPGQSINFHYAATFSPSQLTGNAGYSYVYSGGIELDPGAFVNVQTVPAPEPSSWGLLLAGWFGWGVVSRRLRPASSLTPAPVRA